MIEKTDYLNNSGEENLKKIVPEKVIELLYNLFYERFNVLNISGKAGVGKSSFIQWLVGNMISKKLRSCVWISAGKKFSARRLNELFQKNEKKLNYLKNQFFTIHVTSYFDQFDKIKKIASSVIQMPPEIQFIVVDNVSFHIRYLLSTINDVKKTVKLIDSFFEKQIFPLKMFASRIKAKLIFVHEVSYNPKLDKTIKFLPGVFNRIESINITMISDEKNDNYIEISAEGGLKTLQYKINNEGFEFYRFD